VVAAIESDAVAAARRLAPRALGFAVDRLLIRIAPDEYAALRETEQDYSRRLRKRRLGVLDRIEADLAPEEAAAVWQRIHEVAATVCEHDRRDKQYRLVDAYLAIMHGEGNLACTCGFDTCTAAKASVPTRRKPLVHVTADIATLLGLSAEPGYLAGYGPIDPKLVRTLAEDATWQAMLTDLMDAANNYMWSASDSVWHAGGDTVWDDGDTTPTVDDDGDTAPVMGDHASTAERRCSPPRPASFRVRARRSTPWPPDDPTAHGIPAEVRYRPTADTAGVVRARDQHCRFPSCTIDAQRCELDHVVPFDHAAPDLGGRTTVANLQCLCKFHHQLKTTGLWQAKTGPGVVIEWTSSHGEHHTTTPDGAHLACAATTLTPKVGTGPEKWRPPTHDEPPPF
jgi:Domain of unknown function (DUF222)